MTEPTTTGPPIEPIPDLAEWQRRAELAESRPDGDAWQQLEAERDELIGALEQSQAAAARWEETAWKWSDKTDAARAELKRLRDSHLLLLPRDAIVGYRVTDASGNCVIARPDQVEIVVRGDLGQEGGSGA